MKLVHTEIYTNAPAMWLWWDLLAQDVEFQAGVAMRWTSENAMHHNVGTEGVIGVRHLLYGEQE